MGEGKLTYYDFASHRWVFHQCIGSKTRIIALKQYYINDQKYQNYKMFWTDWTFWTELISKLL